MDARPFERKHGFGYEYTQTVTDRFGIWLSGYRARRCIKTFTGKAVADIGCGFNATFSRSILSDVRTLTLVDVTLADDLKAHPKVTAVEGVLPAALAKIPSESLDVIMCINVLEHLWEPLVALREFRRILKPDGECFLNVPSWSGKFVLETLAFKLRMAPKEEMDDHKAYYSWKELWTLIVKSGFKPSNITCRPHKMGLNTYALCRND